MRGIVRLWHQLYFCDKVSHYTIRISGAIQKFCNIFLGGDGEVKKILDKITRGRRHIKRLHWSTRGLDHIIGQAVAEVVPSSYLVNLSI